MWTVVAVTLSDVILATLQLSASYNRAASKSTSLDASTEMLEEQYVVDNEKPYVAFCENLRRLSAAGESPGHGRELDRYLWITGMYMK